MNTESLVPRLSASDYLAESRKFAELGHRWCEERSRTGGGHEVFGGLYDLILESPNSALSAIIAVVENADPRVMSLAGAGPLESFLALHGDEFIAVIESLADIFPKLKSAVIHVWRQDMSQEVWDRVVRLKGIAAS